ncbi:MAG: fumarylacetoacetate hydrolase family protein, partial [Planctomycetes bacterium]|nr:fumarylacetoacetate hydrolase family protein [Planctomycetota bacterium]
PHPPRDLLCVGQNYLEHALETARFKGTEYHQPEYPVIFSKRVIRAVPPEGEIPAHADITAALDYEAELAVVIGKRCDHVRPEEVFAHVFGYTIVNDVSARDIQMNHVQYTFGKGLDGFAPMGPWIATVDEFAAPPHLNVVTRVNGEVRQNSNTSEFIFDIPRLISELSSGITLLPGDILITGTPSGVGMGFSPPKFLQPGDVVECEIEGIGVLRNVVR